DQWLQEHHEGNRRSSSRMPRHWHHLTRQWGQIPRQNRCQRMRQVTPGTGGSPVMTQPLFSAKCPPQKPYNPLRRSREYLPPEEVEHLLRAARRQGRYKQRNATLMLLMYRHGLRVAELVRLRWEMFDLKAALFHVQRVKNGVPSVHPLRGAEL